MAIVSNVVGTAAHLTFEVGTDQEGNPILKNRSYGNIKASAEDQDIYDVCQVIANLQQHPLASIRKIVEAELINAE